MSADNYLGIVKVGRKYIGHSCFSECEEDCVQCGHPRVFIATSVIGAVQAAQEAMSKDIFEYGYTFKNLPASKRG